MCRSALLRPAVLLVVMIAGLATGCRTTPDGDAPNGPQRAGATLEVRNNNWLSVVVYVVRSGARTRLGTVNSMGEERFRIPASLISTGSGVRLEAHPIGSTRRFVAPPVYVSPGQVIDLTVQNHLSISSVAVW